MNGIIIFVGGVVLAAIAFGSWCVHEGMMNKRLSRPNRWKHVIVGGAIVLAALVVPMNIFYGIMAH